MNLKTLCYEKEARWRLHTVWFHLCAVSRRDKPRHESRSVVIWSWGWEQGLTAIGMRDLLLRERERDREREVPWSDADDMDNDIYRRGEVYQWLYLQGFILWRWLSDGTEKSMPLKEDFLTYISQEKGTANSCRIKWGSIRFGYEAEKSKRKPRPGPLSRLPCGRQGRTW